MRALGVWGLLTLGLVGPLWGKAKPEVQTITVEPQSLVVTVGDRHTFHAVGTTTDGRKKRVRANWKADTGSISGRGEYTAPLTPGMATVTATSPDGALSGSTEVQVVPQPEAIIAAPSFVTMGTKQYKASVLDSAGMSYQWEIEGGVITSSTTAAQITFRPTSVGEIRLQSQVSNLAGRIVHGHLRIRTLPAPEILTFSSAASVLTVGHSTVISIAYRHGTGTLDPLGPVARKVALTVTPLQTTTYTLIVMNKAGDPVSAQLTIQVVPPPDATMTTPSAVTSGVSGFMASVPSVAGSSYQWSLSGGVMDSSSAGNSVTFTPGSPGSIAATCMVNNAAGDSASSTRSIPVLAMPVISSFQSSANVITLGGSATLTPVFSGGMGHIDPGGMTVQSGASVSVAPTMTTLFRLVVDNGAGGIIGLATTIKVVPPPDATITGESLVTLGTTGHQVSVAAVIGSTYAWTITGGVLSGSASTNQILYTVGQGGTVLLQCTVTNEAGTAKTGTFTATTVAPPDATITGPSTVTEGDPNLTASVPTVAGSSYSWTINGGALTTSVSLASAGFSATAVGTTTLTCTVTNAAGVSATATKTVDVIAQPQISSFTATPDTINASGASSLTFGFSGGTGSIDQGVGTVTNGAPVSVSPTTTTTYTLTVTNALGVSIRETVTVNVQTASPGSVNLQEHLVRLTTGGTHWFYATIVRSGTPPPALRQRTVDSTAGQVTATWAPATALWSIQESNGGTITSEGFYTAPMIPGRYHVVATNSTDSTKQDIATVLVIAPDPLISLQVNPHQLMVQTGGVGTFNVLINGTLDHGMDWRFADGVDTPVVQWDGTTGAFQAPSYSGMFNLIATSQADPSKSDQIAISVNDAGSPVVSSFSATPAQIRAGQSTTLSWAAPGATKLTINGLDVTNQSSLVVSPLFSRDYVLIATNGQGSAYAQAHVDVLAPTILSFSPDSYRVPIDGTVTLTANFTNGTGQIDQGVGAVASGIPIRVKPNGNTTYTLTVTNDLGVGTSGTVAIQVTVPGQITTGGSMAINSQYYDFQSAQLYNGHVLSFFGQSDRSNLYDPVHAISGIGAGVPSPTASGGRRYPSFTLMADGRLLLGGGFPNSFGMTAASDWAIYDSATNTFTSITGPPADRHTLVTLLDGRVLLAGGINGSTSDSHPAFPSGSYVFDPTQVDGGSGQWKAVTGDTNIAWRTGEATLLADGRVLLSGGSTCTGIGAWSNDHLVGLFDPTQNSISIIGKLDASFYPSWPDLDASSGMSTCQFALPNGKVLFMGQAGSSSMYSWVFPAAIFDPITNTLTRLQGPRFPRCNLYQPHLLPNGLILFQGSGSDGSDSCVYDTALNAFYSLATIPDYSDWYQTQQSVLLQDGRIFWPGLSTYDYASGNYLPGTVHLFTYPFDLTITPGSASTNVGIPIQFKATTKDGGGVVWSSDGGTIDPASGVFVAQDPRIYYITATDGAGHIAHAQVRVLPVPTLYMTPTAVTLDPGGIFSFHAYLSNTPVQAVTWTVVEGAAGGTINDEGLYVAPAAVGTFHVMASSMVFPQVTAVATVTVQQPTGTVQGLQVLPQTATMYPGGHAAFKAAVSTSSGPSTDVTWQVFEGDAGGTVQPDLIGYARYTAPSTPGTYHLLAISKVDSTVMGMAILMVVSADASSGGSGGTLPSTPVSVTLSPRTADIQAGSYQSLMATVDGPDNTAVTWKVDDGSGNAVAAFAQVDQNGVFVASKAGTYVVTATSAADATASDFASIKVSSSLQALNPVQVPIAQGYQGYSVTALKDGRILVAGGEVDNANGAAVSVSGSAYLYDPVAKTFTPTGSMIQPRSFQKAVLLDDGRVLITDGASFYACPGDPTGALGKCSQYPPSFHLVPWAEIYDPSTGTFQALPMNGRSPSEFQGPGLMNDSHYGGQILKMSNGKVMVWGGWGDFMHSSYTEGSGWGWDYRITTIPDFFDPAANLFALTPDQDIPNAPLGKPFAALANLSDGRVLITGGLSPEVPTPGQVTGPPAADRGTQIFNPNAGTYSPGPSLATPRCDHTATTLSDGRILIVGGAVRFDSSMYVAGFNPRPGYSWQDTPTAEIYDPTTGATTPTGSLNESRAGHAAILLPTGQVLIVGGWHYLGNGQHSFPQTTELYDPDTGTFSVMDHLDYGLSEPKLALLQDGSVFVAGQVQAPMESPVVIAQARTAGANGSIPAAATNSSVTTGTTVFGVMNSSWRVWPPEPEEASLKSVTTTPAGDKIPYPDVTQIAGSPNLTVPASTRISIPLPVNADQTPGTQNLWAGVNRRQRYFILKIQKPSKNYEITGVTVTIQAGGQTQDVLVNEPIKFGLGNGFDGAEQVLPPETIPLQEPEIQLDALFPEDQFSLHDWDQEKTFESSLKQWVQQGAWRPVDIVTRNSQRNDLIEYYRVRVTFDANRPSTINYGVVGGAIVSPPSDTVTYKFKLHYRFLGLPISQPFEIPVGHPRVQAEWSAAQFFRNSWFGSWNNDKWVNKAIFDWLSDPNHRNPLGPVNDITLEHGRNTGHGGEHFTGDRIDMFHPGYQAFTGSDSPGVTGANFRDQYLIHYLQIARKDYPDPKTTSAQANQLLSNWVSMARARLKQIIDTVPANTRTKAMIYMVTDSSSTGTELYCDGYQLYQLLTQGSCDAYERQDSQGNTVTANAITLVGVGPWSDSYIQRFYSWHTTNHTDHLHLRIAP